MVFITEIENKLEYILCSVSLEFMYFLSAMEGLILIAHFHDWNKIITVRVFGEHHQTAQILGMSFWHIS